MLQDVNVRSKKSNDAVGVTMSLIDAGGGGLW